jgi:hypothetical protein
VVEFRVGLTRSRNETVLIEDLPSFYAAGVDKENGIGFTINSAAIRPPTLQPNPFFLDNQIVPQVSAMHTWQRGAATLRSGFDIREIRLNFGNMTFRTPGYTFTGLVGANGVLGSSSSSPQAVAQVANQLQLGVGGGPTTALRAWRSLQQEYFTQLDWRMTPSLTLNAGVRYAYFSPYREAHGFFSNLYAVDSSGSVLRGVSPLNATATAVLPTTQERGLYEPDRNNFQPRVGIAWRLPGGAHVVRGAYGMYIDRVVQLGMSNMTNNPPYAIDGTASNVPFVTGQKLSTVARTPAIFAIDPGLRNPAIHRWNLAYERELGSNMAMTAAYVAARGRGLVRYVEPNYGSSMPQNLRPDPRFAWVRIYGNYSSSDYDSLQLLFRRRFSEGLTVTSTYTYARFFDDASADAEFSSRSYLYNAGASAASGYQGGAIQGQRPIAADFSHSELELPHVFTFSGVYDLPVGKGRPLLANAPRFVEYLLGGWSISPVLLFRSGVTYNVTTGTDYNDDGAFDDRPALAASFGLTDLRYTSGDKTQYLVPQANVNGYLTTPSLVNDPSLAIRRNAFRAPSIFNVDVSLAKLVKITERVALRIEGNAFNLLNKTHLGIPNGTMTSSFFGRITSTVGALNPRQIQLGAKLTF